MDSLSICRKFQPCWSLCSLKAGSCLKCTGEKEQDSTVLVVKILGVIWGVFALTHQQVLRGVLGNTIPMSKGTDVLLQSCVNCCRCQFMVLYWHWNSFVLCCSGLCCPWDIVCLFFICQCDEQVALRTMVNAKSALGIVALCSVLALHCESSFCRKLPCHKLRRRQYKIN